MEGKRLIQRLILSDFLSYGHEGGSIDLLPLNVLIGPNASGKSNLIEALAILRATASDLSGAVREGGGIGEYIRKGSQAAAAVLQADVHLPRVGLPQNSVHYGIVLSEVQNRLVVEGELIEQPREHDGDVEILPVEFYHMEGGRATILQDVLNERGETKSVERKVRRQDLALDQSVLSQRKDPDLYPVLTELANQFGHIAVFREWSFGQRSRARAAQPADLPTDFLLPDAGNLALVLNELIQRSVAREKLIDYLRRFYESARYISVRIQGGSVQLFIEESHGELIPAARLSDGTLRYLSLLTILLHPTPPPLVCIEEPELGLHPDILPTIAELLVDASQRTQLVVTTHSDTLVSALSEVPECIVVCEPGPDGTRLRRLGDAEALAEWLNRYSLGEMWRMGEIGGNR